MPSNRDQKYFCSMPTLAKGGHASLYKISLVELILVYTGGRRSE